MLLLQACAGGAHRIDRQAEAANLSRSVVGGGDFSHVIYANAVANNNAALRRLIVYIDGDGRPWSSAGREPAADPTTRNPVALQLLTRTSWPAIYVSRPCYQGMSDPKCEPSVWTGARYSENVVASLVAAIRKFRAGELGTELTLVGYSGGGVLAILAAERLENVASVVTVAANLDTDAWTQYHHYLPLIGSLNPASSTREHPWRELHLQGKADQIVPAATTDRYFDRYPSAQRRQFEAFTHVCCWVEQWPGLLEEISE